MGQQFKLVAGQLYQIETDSLETTNVASQYPAVYSQMKQKLAAFEAVKSIHTLPPFHVGKEGFKAPHEWQISGR